MSAHNLRRSLRAALPAGLRWVTPKSFRTAAGTLVHDHLGVEAAQHQLGHARLSTTEAFYVERKTVAPDARSAFEQFMGGK
jgi:integrase